MNKVEEILVDIYKLRKDMIIAENGIENANFRIQHAGGEMWENIKKEHISKLEKSQIEFQNLCEKLMSLKSQFLKDQWEEILKKFGVILASTENINHIEESMYDERDLQQALDQTSDKIVEIREKLNDSKEKNDEDSVIIFNGQLSYYENDMKKHYWGESRLEILNSKDENKKVM